MTWIGAPEHALWLSQNLQAVLDYGHRAYVPGGFGYIRADGSVDPEKSVELDLTARSTYVYACASLLGIPGSPRRCDHGIRAITTAFKDGEHEGWFSLILPQTEKEERAGAPGVPAIEGAGGAGAGDAARDGGTKSSRSLSYLLEAAAAAKVAGRPGAADLLEAAIELSEKYYWDPQLGRVTDNYSRDFSTLEHYHGFSTNLHALAAYTLVADATGQVEWLERATRIAQFFIDRARENDWRVPEHYRADWGPDREYNVGRPADPRRPYGINVGHCLGFARWIANLTAMRMAVGLEAPEGFAQAAVAIFDRTVADAWRRDGNSGFFFTTDYAGRPLLRQRFAWVVTEAILTAAALAKLLRVRGASAAEVQRMQQRYEMYWDYAEGYVISANGAWVGELNPMNKPDDTIWPGAPDIFHSARALLAPRLPLGASLPVMLRAGLLDQPWLTPAEVAAAVKGWVR